MAVREESSWEIFRQFAGVGVRGFGGPAAQIADVQQTFVTEKKWLTHVRFNRALGVYQLLPGPEALEMCCYVGAVRGGRVGGFAAGLGFLLPGTLLVLGFSVVYAMFVSGFHPAIAALLGGIQIGAIALLLRAIKNLSEGIVVERGDWLCAACGGLVSVAGMYVGVPMLWVVALVAAGVGSWCVSVGKKVVGYSLIGAVVFFALWLMLAQAISGGLETDRVRAGVRVEGGAVSEVASGAGSGLVMGLRAGMLSFGGAYTAVPFFEEDAVKRYGWLTGGEFLEGMGLVGSVPAPLVSVGGFVGVVGAAKQGAGVGGMLVVGCAVLVGVYLPAFVMTMFGHNWLERISGNARVVEVVDGVTSCVMGIMWAGGLSMLVGVLGGSGAGGQGGGFSWVRGSLVVGSVWLAMRVRFRWSGVVVVGVMGSLGVLVWVVGG